MREGTQFVEQKIKHHESIFGKESLNQRKVPKNVVFFIANGMGISTITAGRVYVGAEKKKDREGGEREGDKNQSMMNNSMKGTPESGPLSFDSFPFTSLLRVGILSSSSFKFIACTRSFLSCLSLPLFSGSLNLFDATHAGHSLSVPAVQ